MATVNKKSLRDELDHLKAEFNVLRKQNNLSKEAFVLFKSLFVLIDMMLVIFLEKTTQKHAKNSSKPSSQTGPDKSALGKPGSKGKGKQGNDETAQNIRIVEKQTTVPVTTCDQCGEPLEKVAAYDQERRTKIDILFETTILHVDADIKACPHCQAVVKGKHPADMPGPLQYGNGLKAYVIQLIVTQMLSLKRVQQLLKTLMGRVIAEKTFLSYILALYVALEGWENSAMAELLKERALNVDETSMRVNKRNQWVHVYSSGDITLKFLQPGRGKQAIHSIGIIPRYGGTIIHDCLKAYLSYQHCAHGLCGSHLLRELTFIVDSNDYRWAKNMKRLLQAACKTVSTNPSKKLSAKKYATLQKQYRNILTRGLNEMPPVPQKQSGKRGRIAKSDAHNLLERLSKYESAVLLFARDPYVSFTNNRAERDLRMGKVKQKVSGCFRSEIYAKAYCRISSYLETMSNKGINPLIAIQMVLNKEI